MDWMSNLASVQQLQLPDRIRQTAVLITTSATELVQDAVTTAAGRAQLQATLCTAMLQSLQPDNAQHNSSRQTAPSTASQACRAAAPAAQVEASTVHIDAVDSAVETNAALANATDANMGCPPPAGAAPIQRASLAEAWCDARAALQVIYRWEDDQVVQDVIAFWGSLCDLLQGAWLRQLSNGTAVPTQCQAATTADVSSTTADSNSQLQQQQAEQVLYIHWLLHLGHPTLSAVVALLHDFCSLTGISALQHKQRTPLMHLLLLFLQVGGSSSSGATASIPVRQLLHTVQWPAVQQTAPAHNSSTPSGHTKVTYAAASAGEALKSHEAFSAVLKLLQSASTYSPSAERPQTLTAAATEGRKTRGDLPTGASISQPQWQQLGIAAGQLLQAAYGWGPQNPSTAARIAMERTHSRPLDTPYDLYIMELFFSMLEGPCGNSSRNSSRPTSTAAAEGGVGGGGGTTPTQTATTTGLKRKQIKRQQGAQEQQWDQWCSSEGFRALAELVVGYDKPQQLVSGLVALSLHQLHQQQEEQGRAQGERAVLTATYSEKHMMNKIMLLLQYTYLWQQEAVQRSSSSNTTSSGSHPANPARVRQLLLGCAELLRPAANCSVEWRCASLELMTAAVEQFMAAYPADGVLCTKLWCTNSLEGVCYCLNHDTSIKARRAAMKLLQMVALPAGSPAAQQLLQTLAIKARDKDSLVAVSALGLLVQLDASVLCSSLSIEQFSGVVQVGLHWCCGDNNAPSATAAATAVGPMEADEEKGPHAAAAVPHLNSKSGNKGRPRGSKAVLPAAAAVAGNKQQSKDALLPTASQKQFLQLLRHVLMCDVAAVQRAAREVQEQGLRQWLNANAHRAVGLAGCRLLLLLLLQDARMATECGTLIQKVMAAS